MRGAAGQAQAAHGGAQGGLVGDLAGGRPHAGAGRRHRVRRGNLRQQRLDAVDEFLVLVQDVRQIGLGGLVGDRVDRAPGGQGRDRHLGHQGEGLVAVQGAGQQVGGLDQEAQGAATQPFQFAEAGRLDGQGDAVGGELKAQRLLVGVPAGCLRRDAEGAGEAALDLERDGDDGAHAGSGEQRYGTGDGGEVVVDGGHAGGAVAAGARFDGYAREALAGGGQAGGGADLQFRLVVGGEQEERGVAVEHVAGAFHRALEETVEVVRGGGADEHLEGVGVLPVGGRGRVGGRDAGRGLQDGAFVVADEEADGGGFAAGVADPEVGGVHLGHAAVGAADAVGALPAGELEGLGDAGAGARGVRPGGQVGEGLADDLGRRVAEQLLGVLVPGADVALPVDLEDGDADAAVGQREEVGGQGRAGGAGADRAFGQVEVEPDVLVGGGVVHAPAGGQGRAELEAAAAFAVGAAHGDGGALEGDLALRVAVGDLDAHAVLGAQAQHLRVRARVDDGVGHQLAGEDDRVVDDVGEPPALEGVADEGPGGRDRSSDGLETGSRARGDHRTPRPVVDMLGCVAGRLAPLLRHQLARRLWLRGLSPGDQSGGHGVRPPLRCPLVLVPPPRPVGPVRLDSRMQGYLPSRSERMPVAGVYAPRVCGRCAKLPNCYGRVRPG